MAEKTPTTANPVVAKKGKTHGKWFQKIPKDVLFSPGGAILIAFALIIEVLDWIPIPGIDNLWELPFEIIFIVFLAIIAKTSFKSLIIPFIIERIPIINDILPTWFLRMFL